MNSIKKTHRRTTKVGEITINTYKNKNQTLALKHPQGIFQVSPNLNFVNVKFIWSSSKFLLYIDLMVLLYKDKFIKFHHAKTKKHLQHHRQRIGERKRKVDACLPYARKQRTCASQPRCIYQSSLFSNHFCFFRGKKTFVHAQMS